MKKIIALVSFVVLSTSAMAAHGPAGCGLGAVIFKDKKGTMWNVLAATTNGSSGNQTFGMSTGTLGCEDAAKARVAAVNFIESNKVALQNDIARGEGETLNAYLRLIEAEKVDRDTLQKNYNVIFSEKRSSADIHKAIMTYIRG